jgi:uncharacterized RDD family membrane protein YckC
MRKRLTIGLFAIMLLGVAAWYLWYVAPKGAPWGASGTLVIATYAMPGPVTEDGRALGVSVNDVRLVREDGEEIAATVLSRHLLLKDTDTAIQRMVETSLAVGSYRGVRITLGNPERRTAWEGDVAASPVTLAGEEVFLEIPFRIDQDLVTALLLGFESNQALRERDGTTVYLPVVHVETRVGASVGEQDDDVVEVRGGEILGNKMFGMDWDGTTYFNYRARADGTTKYAPAPVETPADNTLTATPEEVPENATSTNAVSTPITGEEDTPTTPN